MQNSNTVVSIGRICGRCKKSKPLAEFVSPKLTGKGVNKTYKWCDHCRGVNFGGVSVADQQAVK